jgi:aryl-alcohol dehydrogenase-like predicted oxidoreductase
MAEMSYRNLGSSGLKVSVVGLGCNNFGFKIGEEESRKVVGAALDAGITLFDTAAGYRDSEERLGAALQGHRHGVVVATKFPSPFESTTQGGGSRSHIVAACEGSLRRLGTDYIDLYQMHQPDTSTPIDETLAALDDLVHSGKVRYVGHSNFTALQIADADWTARTNGQSRMVSAQNSYSLLNRTIERDVIPACQRFGLGMLPYLPLASGLLTGKYRRGEAGPPGARLSEGSPMAQMGASLLNDHNFTIVEALGKVAAEAGVSLLQLAMGGLAAQPTVASVIAGATTPEQVGANVEAGLWVPGPDVMAAIDVASPSSRPRLRR